MKTKLLLIAMLLISFTETFSQDYHPLLDNTSWVAYRTAIGGMGSIVYKYIEEGVDTDIDGVTYKKFIDPYVTYGDTSVYLREDSIQRKVYSLIDGSERLIYDFSLETDDLITFGEQTFKATVDFVEVNGEDRKRISLRGIELYRHHDLQQVWIEGIGGTSHPLKPYYNMNATFNDSHVKIFLNCRFQNGARIYGTSDNCLTFLSTDAHTQTAAAIDFYPNPFTTNLMISYAQGFNGVTLKLYNSVGQLVRTQNLNGQNTTLNRGDLANGLYLVQLLEEGALLKTGKLIIAD